MAKLLGDLLLELDFIGVHDLERAALTRANVRSEGRVHLLHVRQQITLAHIAAVELRQELAEQVERERVTVEIVSQLEQFARLALDAKR